MSKNGTMMAASPPPVSPTRVATARLATSANPHLSWSRVTSGAGAPFISVARAFTSGNLAWKSATAA